MPHGTKKKIVPIRDSPKAVGSVELTKVHDRSMSCARLVGAQVFEEAIGGRDAPSKEVQRATSQSSAKMYLHSPYSSLH